MSVNAPAKGIDFQRTFGEGSNNVSGNGSRQDLPKAQLWLNVGYPATVKVNDGEKITEEQRFVSLPVGIPIDTQEDIAIASRNEEFAQFQSARNGLLAQIQAAGAKLKPGEEVELNLKIQLRRINDPVVAPSADAGTNPFVPADLKLVAE